MNAILFGCTKVFWALVVLAVAVLAGCAATGGAMTSGAAAGRAALVDNFSAPTGYTVCLGGHASRFKKAEQAGRVCLPGVSLQEIY